MRLTRANIPAGTFLAALLSISGCNLLDKPGPIVLHLSLHDSLSRYDSVQIAIADADNPAVDLEMVRTGPLPTPSQIASYTLTKATDPFVVKVRGYRGNNQLAVETHIYYEAGRKRVVYQSVPPQVPYNWLSRLTPSSGTMNPAFAPEQPAYTLTLGAGATTVHFDVKSAYARAVTVVGGDTLKVGMPPKVFPVGTQDFTVPVTVTDLGVTRLYAVQVVPAKPPKVELDSLWYSAGTLDEPFDPADEFMTLTLPADVATVTLKFWPVDEANMALHYKGERIFPGTPLTETLPSPGSSSLAPVMVSKGTEKKQYLLSIKRAEK